MSGEDVITAWFARQRKLNRARFPIGIGDDMAEIRLNRDVSILITTDMLLDGTHFDLKKVTLRQAGYKAMAVNLSDCAAMASEPIAAVVSVALPRGFGAKKLKELHKGIISAGDEYGCELVGGDITSWKGKGPFAINVAMISRAVGNKPVRRSGAKVGDYICVTGELGGSGFGKHLRFKPRVYEALKMARMVKINSMMDISDGLSCDLNRICTQSKVGAIVDAAAIPVSRAAKKAKSPLDSVLNEGEDFELLFTITKKEYDKLMAGWRDDLKITKVGVVTNTGKMQIRKANGVICDLKVGGYDHLSRGR